MGTTSFSGPIVTTEAGITSAGNVAVTGNITATGTVTSTGALSGSGSVLVLTGLVGFANDGSPVTLGTLPANAQVLEVWVDVLTAFDSSGTDLIDVGISTDVDEFVLNVDVSSAGRTVGSSTASVPLADWDDVGGTAVTAVAQYDQSVADATAGSARVTILYKQA